MFVNGVQNSTLGRLSLTNLGGVSMRFNGNTTYSLQAAAVDGVELEATNTRLADLVIGSISGRARLVGNVGFSDSQAHAFLDARGHSGARTIQGNVP